MAAFVGRRRRLVTLFNYVMAIVTYTVVIVYITRCHDGQNPKESLDSIKSGARRGDGTVDSALCDERQHPSDRRLSKSNSSLMNSRDNGDEDINDIEKERANEEFIRQPTDAVRNNQLRNKGTTPKVIRLLCWVLTDPAILHDSADARDTWMKDCDVRLFMSSKENKTFPAIGLNVPEGRDHIAEKSKAAWSYIYKNHYNDAEFFVKADPDSYVVVENLKRYLANCNPDEPAIYGHNLFFNYTVYNGGMHYVAGEAIVLGRESLNRLVTKAMLHRDCFDPGEYEDLKTGACLAKVGGYTVDTRDENGRETFLPPFDLEHITLGKMPDWYKGSYRLPYGYCQSIDCLSRYPIAFHYINRQQFYLMNYLFRNLRLLSSASDDHPQFRFNGTRYISQ